MHTGATTKGSVPPLVIGADTTVVNSCLRADLEALKSAKFLGEHGPILTSPEDILTMVVHDSVPMLHHVLAWPLYSCTMKNSI